MAARRFGYQLLCLDWYESEALERQLLTDVLSTQPCGALFVCPFEACDLELYRAVATSVPVVQLFAPHVDLAEDSVVVDDDVGTRLAMDHMLGLLLDHISP